MKKFFAHKNLKIAAVVFLCIFFTTRENYSYAQYTKKGQDFIDKKTGEKVILRGFGLG